MDELGSQMKESEMGPENQVKSFELMALSKMLQDELGTMNAKNYSSATGIQMDEIEEMLKECSVCEKHEHDQEFSTLTTTTINHSLISIQMDKIEEMLKNCSICEKYEHDQELSKLTTDTMSHSLNLQHIEKYKDDEQDCKSCKSITKEVHGRKCIVKDLTCDSMDFIGLPLVSNNSEIKGLERVLEKTTGVKVGLIDSYHLSKICDNDYDSFKRTPISQSVHDCDRETKLSGHGFLCASILAGKPEEANFFGLCQGTIRVVVPDAQLHVYVVGCLKCERSPDNLARAMDLAINDEVRVISMSQGMVGVSFEDFDDKWRFDDDVLAQRTLEAFKKNILTCLPAGNDGPASESLLYGYPWCVNVGACTIGKNLITKVAIGTRKKRSQLKVKILRTIVNDRNQKINILEYIEGISMNIVETPLRPLRLLQNLSKDNEGVLYAYEDYVKWTSPLKKHRLNLYLLTTTQLPMVRLSRDSCQRINYWRDETNEQLYVNFSKSTSGLDRRGCYVPEFSGKGPSRKCPEIIMPDLVAPGCNILGSHPRSIPIGSITKKKENTFEKEDLFNSQKIMTGTSVATPHVAGLFTALLSNRPEWTVARAKSAAITTALSFADRNLFGDEFMFGAGLMQLENALNPGLVYDESYENFMKYAKGKWEVDDLNLPSFAASFTQSHEKCERILRRELTNIDEKEVLYESEIKLFNTSLDKDASITVYPTCLRFLPGEKRKFILKIELCPKPMGHISGVLIWKEKTSNISVVSPIHFYHKSGFDRRLWYYEKTVREKKMQEKLSRENSGDEEEKIKSKNDKGKGKMRQENDRAKEIKVDSSVVQFFNFLNKLSCI